jgi:hypothetical protein
MLLADVTHPAHFRRTTELAFDQLVAPEQAVEPAPLELLVAEGLLFPDEQPANRRAFAVSVDTNRHACIKAALLAAPGSILP